MRLILLLVTAVLVLFLTACAAHSVKDDSPASDLDAYLSNVKENSRDRKLPNGKIYCAELATTESAQDDCMGDLEDTLFLAEKDKDNLFILADKFVLRLKLVRNPCSHWERLIRSKRCTVK